jgi:hypothetical protein
MMSGLAIRPLVLLFLVACRAEQGDPQYPEYVPWEPEEGDGRLPGPFPYVDGEDRLSLSAFYDGQASETIVIDDSTTHYYIYEGTYTQAVSDDRIEGLVSDVLTVSGAQPWWGGGVAWDNPTDLSDWTTLHVSLRSDEPLYETMAIAISGGTEGRVAPATFGFVADGEWHSLVIPLASFPGVDFGAITTPVSFVADAGTPDSQLFIDDLYFTKE